MRPLDNAPLVTGLLRKWQDGDALALDQLLPLVQETLHRLAHRHVNRERPGHTLQTTALVNEAFIRLVGQQEVDWQSRAHFFAVSAQVMRHILVDYARQRASGKRGGEFRHVTLDGELAVSDERSAELVALDEALESLAQINPRGSKVVVLRYFGGMNNREAAEVLQVSETTVERDWRLARAWLYRELRAPRARP
jgi:RNA polymerase sigma factor (TIGR02999 family)